MTGFLVHLTATPGGGPQDLHGYFYIATGSKEEALKQSKVEFSRLARAYYTPPVGKVIASFPQSITP